MTARVGGVTGLVVLALLGGVLVACGVGTPDAATSDVVAAQPWVPGERYEYAVSDGRGTAVGQGVLTTTREGDRLILQQRYVEANPPAGSQPTTDTIALTVDAATLGAREGRRETQRRSAVGETRTEHSAWRYADIAAVTHLTTRRDREGAPPVERDLALRAHASDNEASLWLWRALAFADGYAHAYVAVDPYEADQQAVSVRVPRRESMTVPAGAFSTWRVILRSGRAVRTAWINVDAPHQVVRWDSGDLVFELTQSVLPR